MPVSRNRKNHKKKVDNRKNRINDIYAAHRKQIRKIIDEHQKELEEDGSVAEVLKKKNNG